MIYIPDEPLEPFNRKNPDHTGWPHFGLLHSIALPSRRERNYLLKRIYYEFFVPRFFPFTGYKRVKPLKGLSNPQFFLPCQLHRSEGKEAQIWRLQSLVFNVLFPHHLKNGTRFNVHIYTADDDNELPLEATMDDILQGKFGVMSAEQPLRIVYIPGKAVHIPTRFPGPNKRAKQPKYNGLPSSSLRHVSDSAEGSAFGASVSETDPPPPYDFKHHEP